MSRTINALGLIVVVIGSLQVGGAFDLFPAKVAAVLIVVGATASALSERLQGRLSK